VKYGARTLKWDTLIEQKTVELGGYLVGRTPKLDFSEPSPNLHGMDDRELRRRILSLTQQEARRLGIGKSTLHYLRRNARDNSAFKIYEPVGRKLRQVIE
jgi:CRISPR-associated protein Cas1